ncbi:MAG: hypothetical protein ABIR80_05990 [Opitutaceae bacterium]
MQPGLALEDRVLRFLGTRKGAEAMDALTMSPEQQASEKADFFLSGREVVCEVKSLQTDTKEKIEKLVAPLSERPDMPLYYGSWPIEKVLRHFPEGEQIKRELYDAATTAVQTLFRKANRQIRATKQVFSRPRASGALVIANDLIDLLSPEVLGRKVWDLFGKRTSEGDLQFPEVECVWIICETHFAEIAPGHKGVPAIVLSRPGTSIAERVMCELQPQWAEFHGMPLVSMNSNVFHSTSFQEFSDVVGTAQKIPLHEAWRRAYRQNPYLRRHTIPELKSCFALLMTGITPGMLKGASDEQRNRSRTLIERWTHFLEEVNERGLDMKIFQGALQSLGDQVRSGAVPIVTPEMVDKGAQNNASFAIGTYYTNKLGKRYRCMAVDGDRVSLLLIDSVMGKTLEAEIKTKASIAADYWPIIDPTVIATLETRFLRYLSRPAARKK